MSVVILCGIVDDCSSDENVVCVGRVFVDDVLGHFIFISSYQTLFSWLKLCG